MSSFLDWSTWVALAQDAAKAPVGGAAPPAGGGAGGAAAPPANPPGLVDTLFSPMTLLAIVAMLFYFMVVRPKQTEESERDKRISELKVNDRVYTYGGILGTIVDVDKEKGTFTLRTDEKSGARLTVLRSAVGGLEKDVTEEEEKKDS
jgi:preprotein translocase subunit YajC